MVFKTDKNSELLLIDAIRAKSLSLIGSLKINAGIPPFTLNYVLHQRQYLLWSPERCAHFGHLFQIAGAFNPAR